MARSPGGWWSMTAVGSPFTSGCTRPIRGTSPVSTTTQRSASATRAPT